MSIDAYETAERMRKDRLRKSGRRIAAIVCLTALFIAGAVVSGLYWSKPAAHPFYPPETPVIVFTAADPVATCPAQVIRKTDILVEVVFSEYLAVWCDDSIAPQIWDVEGVVDVSHNRGHWNVTTDKRYDANSIAAVIRCLEK